MFLTIRPFFRIVLLPFYRWWALRYIRAERRYRYGNLNIRVPSGVFHPGIFFSTPIFLHFLTRTNFYEKTVLDIGTGSGILAIFAAKNGGLVTAVDLNPQAISTAAKNAKCNGCRVLAIQSDLFDQVQPQAFDYILVNPPYYPQTAKNDPEKAFFAGDDLEYFDRFFSQLSGFIHHQTNIWMILSEDCHWVAISAKAARFGFAGQSVFTKKKWGERFDVYQFKNLSPKSLKNV